MRDLAPTPAIPDEILGFDVDREGITARVARHVLAHFDREGGVQAGGFITDLISLIARADVTNKRRLLTAYPGYSAAVLLAQHVPGGTDILQQLAAQEET